MLVTADHGGKGKGHGGNTMAEIEIPWIIAGPGVVPGKEITTAVNTYDTAATIAYIFGLTPPKCWIARPVEEAFSANDPGHKAATPAGPYRGADGGWLRGILPLPVEPFGNAAFDCGRTDRSRAAPSVADAKEQLGWAVSLGTVGYAIGKFAAGSLVDLLGGRRNYLIGMAGAVICTVLFALGGSIPVFTLDLVREPSDPIAGLAGNDQDHVAVVFLFTLWHGDGRDQLELPVWRCACAGVYGVVDSKRGLAGGAFSGSRQGCWGFCGSSTSS